MIFILLLGITSSVYCFVDQQLGAGIDVEIDRYQENKLHDSLIPNRNYRKREDGSWRRNLRRDTIFENAPRLRKSMKGYISSLRRDSENKPVDIKEPKLKIKKSGEVDVKFTMDKPSRGASTDDFANPDENVDVRDLGPILRALEEAENRKRLQNAVDHLHGEDEKPSRRTALKYDLDPEREILFHHAVPIDMKIYGYLQVPDKEKNDR